MTEENDVVFAPSVDDNRVGYIFRPDGVEIKVRIIPVNETEVKVYSVGHKLTEEQKEFLNDKYKMKL